MSVETFASVASFSAPVVAIVMLVVLALLSCRAGIGALGFTLKRRALRWIDLSIAASLLVFAVCVFTRFKVIG
jgi:hypothetical protein